MWRETGWAPISGEFQEYQYLVWLFYLTPPRGLYIVCNEFEVFKVAYTLEKQYRNMAACKMMNAFTWWSALSFLSLARLPCTFIPLIKDQ